MKENNYTVYMVECNDKSLYIGMTSNLEMRLFEHNSGAHQNSYTYNKRPVKIVYTAVFTDVYEAITWERQIKRWSRAKKQALIQHDWNKISTLAACKKGIDSRRTSTSSV